MRLWFQGGRLVMDEHGRPVFCERCPCGRVCEPKDLHSFTTSGRDEETRTHDLAPWAVEGVGWPGGVWRLVELTDCYIYASGLIDEDGRLVGLPAVFVSEYHYQGYMLLQQGCQDEFGAVAWPPAGACDNMSTEKKE